MSGKTVLQTVQELDAAIKFNASQKNALKAIHCELNSAIQKLEGSKNGSYNQKLAAHDQVASILDNLPSLACQGCPVDTVDSVKDLECYILAGDEAPGAGEQHFGGARYSDWQVAGTGAEDGEAGDHVERPLQAWNNIPDLAAASNYLRILSNGNQTTITTDEATVNQDGGPVGNLTAYALVNDYLPALNKCNGCVTAKAVNKFRVREFEYGTGSSPGSDPTYEPEELYKIQARLIGHEYEDQIEFITDGSYPDFTARWNDSDLGEYATAEHVTDSDVPYVEITVKSGADLAFGIAPAEENQWVQVEVHPVVEGEIRNPNARADNTEDGDCLTLNTENTGFVDILLDCPGDATGTRRVDGRDHAIISGYVTLYSPDRFRVETDNDDIVDETVPSTFYSETVSRDFPHLIDWCYKLSEGVKVRVPTNCGSLEVESKVLALPLGIFARLLKDEHLCELDACEVDEIIASMEDLFELMILHTDTVNLNEDRLNNLKCSFIKYANECIQEEDGYNLDHIYGKDKCVVLDRRFCRARKLECKRKCFVDCPKSKSKSSSSCGSCKRR